MAQNIKKKKNQISPKKLEAKNTSSRPWPNDLPYKELTRLISNEPGLRIGYLIENISFSGVTKSWRSGSRKCMGKSIWPQLTEIQQNRIIHSKYGHKGKYNYPLGKKWPTWKHPWINIKGLSHGVLIAIGPYPDDIFMWESYKENYCLFPIWDTRIPFKFATLSTSLFNDYGKTCIVMVLTGVSSPAFVYHKLGNEKECAWKKQDCNFIDPFGLGERLQFVNAIGFNGKFYALSLQGTLAVIEEIDCRLKVTEMSSSRAVPYVLSRQFREFLVESDGEILLIFLISKRSIKLVDDVEVYRLDFSRLLWVKMETLGHRTLIIEDECCMWINARKMRCRSNCIYFTQKETGNWLLYDMQAKVISPAERQLFAIECLVEN